MACSNKMVISKTLMEEYRINWRIANFLQIRNSKEALEAQIYRFEMGASINLRSKWKCYLTCHLEDGVNGISPNIGLEENPAVNVSQLPISLISLNIEVNNTSVFRSGPSPLCDMLQNSYFRLFSYMPQALGFPHFDNFVDADGSLVLNIMVNLFNFENIPTPQVQIPLSTLQSQFELKCRKKLQQDLSKLCKNPDTLSQTLGMAKLVSSDNREYFVNPEILTVCCPVLYSMLAEETSSVLQFSDISGQHLETLLSFMYTVKLPENWKLTTDELLHAAQKFGLDGLVEFLEETRFSAQLLY